MIEGIIHRLKILDIFADDILVENKTFELRYNDRNYKKGDFIKFVVVDSEGHVSRHPPSEQGVVPDSIFFGRVGSEGWLCCPRNIKIAARTFALNSYVAMPKEKCYNKYGRTGNLAAEKKH